jgi:hypothetical protein
MSSGGVEVGEQLLDPSLDLVADWAYGLDALARRVLEFPVLVALVGEDQADVPQPIVMITSLLSAVSTRQPAAISERLALWTRWAGPIWCIGASDW